MISKAEIRGLGSALCIMLLAVLLVITVNWGPPGQQLLHSLRFHIVVAGLVLAVLLLVSGARWRALVMIVVLLASAGEGAVLIDHQQIMRARVGGTVQASLDVLSFNVLAGNTRGREVVDFLMTTAPDIAVIMETPGIEPYLGRLASVFPSHVGCATAPTCDLSLFSRTPLIDPKVYLLGPLRRLRLITAGIMVDDRNVTIVAVHLSKPYFDETMWIELLQVRRLLRSVEGPIILAGDFNAAAWSGDVSRFVQQTGLVPAPAYPATWPAEFGQFGVPIDNMFTRGGAIIQSIEALPDALGSSHRALVARVDILAP